MFGFQKKSSNQDEVNLSKSYSLSGLHCSSCAVNIDMTLEDLEGVSESKTNYQKSTVTIKFDPNKVTEKAIKKEIVSLGYKVN